MSSNQQWRTLLNKALLVFAIATLFLSGDFLQPQTAAAYPFWAQENYQTPREATGRIVCANCHLAQKPIEVEVPHSVLPNTVFEAVVKIPYDLNTQQVLGDGSKGGLNVGAVMMLPEGFKIAPEELIPEEMKEKVGDTYFMPYSEEEENIVLVGPMPGEDYQEIIFPVLSPDPATQKGVYFGKYPIHVGGNRGRGQVYPTGDASNNTAYKVSTTGTITLIEPTDFGSDITIQTADGETVVESVPPGPELIVSEGAEVTAGQVITNDPNVGGFGQKDAEIVLQSSTRIVWLLIFFAAITVSQIMLILKKKQVEKVQAAEMNF